ncbi:YjcQ family protein [Apilactobacillus xinyiensis]|uniref:YjcQ family protein n=1 Tax=Apilactobacillus xinyiensis TaxID=2841032 RepID=UPI00200FC5A9|nr:YjcQ family protein [Apilactobacillus xinyiensis]MCL0330663.1 DUF2513 domain-containing protein [Apilactobacillus xinyiensis]
MKLNYDCVRDTLICIETNLKVGKGLLPNELIKKIQSKYDYSEDDIVYTLSKLREGNYIIGGIKFKFNAYGNSIKIISAVSDITFKGHEYLNTIRDNKVWKKTKSVAKSFKGVPLSVMGSLAEKVLTSIINQKTGWNI